MDDTSTAAATLTLELPDTEAGVYVARCVTRTLLELRRVHGDKIDDCLLVVGELGANAVLHSRSRTGTFSLYVRQENGTVAITVTDYGAGFDPDAVLPIGTERDNGRIGGFGIPLVKTLCQRADWVCTERGTTVNAVIDLRAPVAASIEGLPDLTLALDDELDWDLEPVAPRRTVER